MIILEFIIAFGLLIFLHELGHFLVCQVLGIEVEEFGFGYPPRLLKLGTWKGTEISLNWIPFGGFVRPKGENDPNIRDGLRGAKPWKRIAVALGGPLMNLLTGLIIFTAVFAQVGSPDTSRVQIVSVSPDSPAAAAGILPNDIILDVNGIKIDSMARLSSVVQENLGNEISITYEREGIETVISATPRVNPPEGEGSLGIVMSNPVVKMPLLQAVGYSGLSVLNQGRQLVMLPQMLAQGQVSPEQARIVGPIGIYDMYAQAREMDTETAEAAQPQQTQEPPAVNTLALLGIITVALGFTNLLPILPLDGGIILFALIEMISRKQIPIKFENLINMVSFALMIGLMLYVTAQDIINPILMP